MRGTMETKKTKNDRKNTKSSDSKEVAAAKQKKLNAIPSPGTWERENLPDISLK